MPLIKCLKKIGQQKGKENTKYDKLYNRWKLLKEKDDPASRSEMEVVEDELADEYWEILKASNYINPSRKVLNMLKKGWQTVLWRKQSSIKLRRGI